MKKLNRKSARDTVESKDIVESLFLISMSICMTAVYNFQTPICTAGSCRSLPHAFSPCVHDRCDVVYSHSLQVLR